MLYTSVIKIVLETLAAKNSYDPCETFGEMRCLLRNILPNEASNQLGIPKLERDFNNNLKSYEEALMSLRNNINVESRYLDSHFGENQLDKRSIIELLYPGLKGRTENLLDTNFACMDVDFLFKALEKFKNLKPLEHRVAYASDLMDTYIPAARALNKVMQHGSTRDFFDGLMRRAAHLSCHSKKPMRILRKDAPAWLRGE